MIAKAPFELQRDTFLRAIEFIPGNRRGVHHMNGAMISYAYEEGCRQRYILAYFGDPAAFTDDCGSCDRCLGAAGLPVPELDAPPPRARRRARRN